MKMRSKLLSLAFVTMIAAGGLTATAWTQATETGQPQRARSWPDLAGGLRATEGCLGIESARAASGKQVIFAWFEDKASVVRWYYGEVHQGAMDLFMTSAEYAQRKPMEHVRDDAGPIMVVASLTPAPEPAFAGIDLPISQIAIELYEPLPGGAFLGARFAPPAVKVDHLRDYTP
jgi:hypothetical protein